MTENNAAQAANPDFVASELRGIIDVCGDSPTAIVSVERMSLWLSELRAEGVQAGDERAVRIPVPFSVDTTHKNQAFVTLGFYDEALRKEFVRAVCSGGFRVPTAALASAPVPKPWPVENSRTALSTRWNPADMASAPVADERLGAHVREWATLQGWKPGDAEGAWEYAQRISYTQGLKDAAPYWSRTYEDQDDYDKAVADAIKRVSERVEAVASSPVALAETERHTITGLIAVARAAFNVADDAEDDGDQIKVGRSDADALGAALDALGELPDDQPGYTMGPSNKAEWALRRLLDVASAPVADAVPVKAFNLDSPDVDVEIQMEGVLVYDHGPNIAEALARLAQRVARWKNLSAPSLAALASAPVAGEAQHGTDSVCAWQVWWNQHKSRYTTTRQASLAAFAAGKEWRDAAPQASTVAGEEQHVAYWLVSQDWNGSLVRFAPGAEGKPILQPGYSAMPLYAAPQASEAVRNAALEEAALVADQIAEDLDRERRPSSVAARRIAAAIRALKQPQADKDCGPQRARAEQALHAIAEYPIPEQDNMPAANMRAIARAALSATQTEQGERDE